MSSPLVATPALVPLAAALIAALCGKRPDLQRAVALGGLAVLFGCVCALLEQVASGGAQRMAFGDWPAPYGIQFVVDGLSVSLLLITSVMGLVVVLFQSSTADPAPNAPSLLPLLLALVAGIGGAFATGDLFNLYVWLEVTLLSALGLLALGAREASLDATLKYFVLNALGTLLFLMGIAHLYGATGHLSFGALQSAAQRPDAGRWLPLTITLAVALLVKAGAFPVFAWLPASYHTLPAPVLALFAGLLTKVGVYGLLRLFGDVFVTAPTLLFEALGWLAVATMFIGALGAAYHWDMRRILAFHVISQIGYLLLGVALGTRAGAVATVFYLLHNVLAKTNLILVAALARQLTGSYDLRRCGGLYAARPLLSVVFLISALAMVGVPPLSGFWAKLLLLRETVALGRGLWTSAALVTSFLTLYSMVKIWLEAFWKSHPDGSWRARASAGLGPAHVAVGGVTGLILALGLAPEPVLGFLDRAAASLGNRVQADLGEPGGERVNP